MSEELPDRRAGWFDKRISLKEVLILLGLIFALGQLYTRFEVLERRLEKKIEIINAHEAAIQDLEIELAKLGVRLPSEEGGR